MGKVVKINEDKFTKLFEMDGYSEDEELELYRKFRSIKQQLAKWCDSKGLDTEEEGAFLVIYLGSGNDGRVWVDFDTDEKRISVFKIEFSSSDGIQVVQEFVQQLIGLISIVNEMNKRITNG